jgi:hypothetical protein
VVEPGAWRLGGQLTAAGFCNLRDLTKCHDFPDGAPLPELRLDARRGVGGSSDLAASLQVQGALFSPDLPLQVGLVAEGKRELLASRAGSLRHLLSAGVLAGGAFGGRFGLPPSAQLEAGVPVFYGLQTERYELVASGSLTVRGDFREIGASIPRRAPVVVRVGTSLGLYRRNPSGWAVQLGYLTRADALSAGALQLEVGLFWDLQGRD